MRPRASKRSTMPVRLEGSQWNLDTALRRITEHVQPYEDARLREHMRIGTKLARILTMERDFNPGRTTVILVREPVGV